MRIGYCKYCGQSMTLDTEQDGPQEHLDEKATWNCKCTEAKAQRNRTERLERVFEYIDNLVFDEKNGRTVQKRGRSGRGFPDREKCNNGCRVEIQHF